MSEKKEKMKTSDRGVGMIMEHEALRLEAYPDPGAVQAAKKKGLKPGDPGYGVPWTIGYGHTGGVRPGDKITESKAEELLKKDLEEREKHVKSLVTADLNQNQFDALVSFVFNEGYGNFYNSTLRKKLNQNDYTGAAKEFDRWIFSKGEKMKGLERRRKSERDLFETPMANSSYSNGSSSNWRGPGSYLPHSSSPGYKPSSPWIPSVSLTGPNPTTVAVSYSIPLNCVIL